MLRTYRCVTLALALMLGFQPIISGAHGPTWRIVPPNDQGNASARNPCISGDGRYVAFSSYASNYVPNDTNETGDVFVYDRLDRTFQLASQSSTGELGDDWSGSPSISEHGRYVAFESHASTFAPAWKSYVADVFVRDMKEGTTILVSTNMHGERGNSVSQGGLQISAGGRHVAFASSASDLVLDDTNNAVDVFVRDLVEGVTTRVSMSPSGTQMREDSYSPSISADGRYVAFCVRSEYYVHDCAAHATTRIPSAGGHGGGSPDVSPDGRYIAFLQYGPSYVPNPYRLMLYDIEEGTVRAALSGLNPYPMPQQVALSWDGRYVALASGAPDLVQEDTNEWSDVFILDTVEGVIRRISQAFDGGDANGDSSSPSISYDGATATYLSDANNLVTVDTNAEADVFLWSDVADGHSLFLPLILRGD